MMKGGWEGQLASCVGVGWRDLTQSLAKNPINYHYLLSGSPTSNNVMSFCHSCIWLHYSNLYEERRILA